MPSDERRFSFHLTALALALAALAVTACSGAASTTSGGAGAGSTATVLPVGNGRTHPNSSAFDWQTQSFEYTSTGNYSPTVYCPMGELPVAGGYDITSGLDPEVSYIRGSYPKSGTRQWEVDVRYYHTGGASLHLDITLYVACTAL